MNLKEYQNTQPLDESFIWYHLPDPSQHPSYMSKEWFDFLRSSDINLLISEEYAERELFRYLVSDIDNNSVQRACQRVLIINEYKYDHLWALYEAEYNPIWNVEGTETLARTGNETDTGTDTNVRTGSEAVAHTGNDTSTDSGTDTHQRGTTTYDSNTNRDTDRDALTYGRQNTRTANLTDTTTYNSVQDKRTADLTHGYNWTETRTRGGNIGVTMTQQMEEAEMDWANRFNFLRIVMQDIVGAISYPFV